MSRNLQDLVRATLRAYPDGMTPNELADELDLPYRSVQYALHCMDDAYIDRWTRPKDGKSYSAVWCVVEVPENCPRPT